MCDAADGENRWLANSEHGILKLKESEIPLPIGIFADLAREILMQEDRRVRTNTREDCSISCFQWQGTRTRDTY